MKTALVTGGSGQDGWYLIELLAARGYNIHAHARKLPTSEFHESVQWHIGDLTDTAFLETLIKSVAPDEIYNFAAVSQPALSWSIPLETARINAFVPHHICELLAKSRPGCRMFQATSSEIFGDTSEPSQNENSKREPRSPYAISKDYAHRIVRTYREQYGLHLSSGILFNHESPRRPLFFVSQKIVHAAAAVSLGIKTTKEIDELGKPLLDNGKMRLGDLNVRRDFGFAGDYVEIIHKMVQSETPDDFVIGTGEHHSIAEICEIAFSLVGKDWNNHVIVDPTLIRKKDNHYTHADISKLRERFNWNPPTKFKDLIKMMLDARVASLRGETSAAVPLFRTLTTAGDHESLRGR